MRERDVIVPLSSGALDTLRSLFFEGPTWDGDIPSKQGRKELVEAGYAVHREGWASLTEDGLVLISGLPDWVSEKQLRRHKGTKQRLLVMPSEDQAVSVGGSRFDGWLCRRHPDGQWVTVTKLREER